MLNMRAQYMVFYHYCQNQWEYGTLMILIMVEIFLPQGRSVRQRTYVLLLVLSLTYLLLVINYFFIVRGHALT